MFLAGNTTLTLPSLYSLHIVYCSGQGLKSPMHPASSFFCAISVPVVLSQKSSTPPSSPGIIKGEILR